MNIVKSCCINSLKCCTDKLLGIMNIAIGLPGIGCIIGKSYHVPGLKKVSWEILIIPLSILLLINIFYFLLCRTLLRSGNSEGNYGSPA